MPEDFPTGTKYELYPIITRMSNQIEAIANYLCNQVGVYVQPKKKHCNLAYKEKVVRFKTKPLVLCFASLKANLALIQSTCCVLMMGFHQHIGRGK